MKQQQVCAIFDIDGTIFRYSLFQALLERLVENDTIPSSAFADYETEMNEWKRRSHSESFRAFVEAQIKVFDTYITSIQPSDLESTALAVLHESSEHVYVYTRDLIENLRDKNYFLIAISGSLSEIAVPFAEQYGFDAIQSSQYVRKNGAYTGEFITKHTDKHIYIQEIIAKHNLKLEGSIAIGDSKGDTSMLELVEQPIAFNPERSLFEHARRKGWNIVVERKNMIYEMEQTKRGEYRLVTTGE